MRTVRFQGRTDPVPVGNIFCLGRNYAEHAREMRMEVSQTPIIFLKPATAIIPNGAAIVIPSISHEMHHEVELVVAIGKDGKHIPRKTAYEHVSGYAVGLDMTLRDIQGDAKKRGLPWSVAKGFDTSAPVSEIVPAPRVGDPHSQTITCSVNGSERQRSSTGLMITKVDEIIEYISSIFTLGSGDLIFTGTPEGVGPVKAGDVVEAELLGLAKTSHPVKSE